jgi:hypothetical protein
MSGMGKPVVELTGRKFGKLTVLERAGSKHGHIIWLCQCECGNQTKVYRGELVKGKTKSCGCSQGKKPESAYGRRNGTKLYDTWKNIQARCHNPNHPAFKNYGARGIEVCERWRSDFLAFASDMGDAPSPAHTIERVDNDKGYGPDNCKWATRAEQRANQRHSTRKGEANARAKLSADDVRAIRLSSLGPTVLAEAYGIARETVHSIRSRKTWTHID